MNREAGNAPQACASCKHQRKKCDESCELAPYFPASRYREFQNAHRLFGVSNIQKIMNTVEPHQRQAAAESILMEGNARRNDPVHGCLGIVRNLKSQIEFYEKQLQTANQYLAFFRESEKIGKQKQRMEDFLTSPPPLAPTTSVQQQDDQLVDGFKCLTPILTDLPSEYLSDMKNSGHGYNYQSTLEEGADVMKPFDIQSIDQMIESFQHENVLTSFDGPGESSNADSKAKGKKPLEYCVAEEDTENDEDGSSPKGKEDKDINDDE